jgi:hypothetical protein
MGELFDAGSQAVFDGMFGNGSEHDALSGGVVGADARQPERAGEGLRGNLRAAHSEFSGACAAFRSVVAGNEVG